MHRYIEKDLNDQLFFALKVKGKIYDYVKKKKEKH